MPERNGGRAAFPVVISGPSGVGKSTICNAILERDPETAYSVSVTTRAARGSEVTGEHYEFVTEEEFDALARNGDLAEWAVVHGFRYGTRKSVIEETTRSGKDVVMDVDVQGGMSIKKLYPESVLIFVLPPSRSALEERLRGRATDSDEVISTRLSNAFAELAWAPEYDYLIVNDDVENAVKDALSILAVERMRASRWDVRALRDLTQGG